MMYATSQSTIRAFSLVEVVIAIGVVGFAVLATFGLLSVAGDTGRNARDEQSAARVATNEFNRLRSLSVVNFPTAGYDPRYYDVGLADLGKMKDFGPTPPPTAVYKVSMYLATPSPSPGPADWIVNAEVAYPAQAPSPTIVRFTTLMNTPVATPAPTATPTPAP